MKYVLDSSVAVKWVLPEVDSARALQLLDDYAQGIHELIAPDIFMPEVANALASAERQGRIKPGEAGQLLRDVIRNTPVIIPSTPYLPRAVEVSIADRQAVYDCLFLALAEHEPCEMVSADDLFIRKMRPKFPFLLGIIDLP